MNNIIYEKDLTKTAFEIFNSKKVVFTNGCFDILHAGHVSYLNQAKSLGEFLIVGINSDSSIKKIKGEKRPIVLEKERATVLAGLKSVDMVVIFNDDTPLSIIKKLLPNVLVKGGDWPVEKIVGHDVVLNNGGEVKSLMFLQGNSTTDIIKKVLNVYGEGK